MNVLIDDKVPYIQEAAEWLLGNVRTLPGAEFGDSRELREADALIIRTRTRCDEQLLANTKVKFVATATIGYDHIDADFMQRAGIGWTNCPGCNASAVAQYVRNAIEEVVLTSSSDSQWSTVNSQRTVGIVGYGHVGRQVKRALEDIDCRVLLNDPPLEESGVRSETSKLKSQISNLKPQPPTAFVSLQEIAEQCDVITFHTPLTKGGPYPTWHLADEGFFTCLKRKPVIINAARGGVVDEAAMLRAYSAGQVGAMVIDTWEGEPHINRELLHKAFIATPHIAGYSADGKCNATRMALRAVCDFFGVKIEDEKRFLAMTAPPDDIPVAEDGMLAEATRRLKACPQDIEMLRGNYPLRREGLREH